MPQKLVYFVEHPMKKMDTVGGLLHQDRCDRCGWAPLHAAASCNALNVTKTLLAAQDPWDERSLGLMSLGDFFVSITFKAQGLVMSQLLGIFCFHQCQAFKDLLEMKNPQIFWGCDV